MRELIQEFYIGTMGYTMMRKKVQEVKQDYCLEFCVIYCIFPLPLVWYISPGAMKAKGSASSIPKVSKMLIPLQVRKTDSLHEKSIL